MSRVSPLSAGDPSTYECMNCGTRIEAATRPGKCPDCEGEMKNISNPSVQ